MLKKGKTNDFNKYLKFNQRAVEHTLASAAYGGCTASVHPQSFRSRSHMRVVFMYTTITCGYLPYTPFLCWCDGKCGVLFLTTAVNTLLLMHIQFLFYFMLFIIEQWWKVTTVSTVL